MYGIFYHMDFEIQDVNKDISNAITISILSCKKSLMFVLPAYSIAWWPELSFSVGSASMEKTFVVMYH